jgi:hypothetical protein
MERYKTRLEILAWTVNACIVVTEVSCKGEAVVTGALVDSVREVFQRRFRTAHY